MLAGSAATWLCLAAAAGADDRVYWANFDSTTGNRISFAKADGTGGGGNLNTGAATVSNPFGLAIDPVAGRIYWANQGASKISFANLDGSGGADLTITGATVSGPEGLAIDPAAGRLYWVNNGPPEGPFVANLDGSGGAPVNHGAATVAGPIGVAIDPQGGRVWWSNSSPTNKISFANLDGSGGGDLAVTGVTVNHPEGLAIDRAGGRIWWANFNGNSIASANLDGSAGATLDTTGATAPNNPSGVAVDRAGGRVWWANEASSKLSSASLGGGGGRDLDTTNATAKSPEGLSLLFAPRGASAPAITGGTSPGSTLSCSPATWQPNVPSTFLFLAPAASAQSWSRDGTTIAGATASTLVATDPGQYRCIVTASNAAGATAQTSAAHTVLAPPVAAITSLTISPSSFLAAVRGPSARAGATGARVAFRLDRAATVTFRVRQARSGRRDPRGRCVAPTRANRTRRRCVRYVTLPGSFVRSGKAGRNTFRFTGRLRGLRLNPGRYLLAGTPAANGKRGRVRTTAFRVLTPRRVSRRR